MVDPSLDNPNVELSNTQDTMSRMDGNSSMWRNSHNHTDFQGNGYSAANEATQPLNDLSSRPDDIEGTKDVDISATAGNGSSGQDEEAVVYTNTRMLQDPTGRLRESRSNFLSKSYLRLVSMSNRSQLTQSQSILGIPPYCRFCS